MLSEEENNRFQHVLAMAICNRCLDLLTLILGLKTPLFVHRIILPDICLTGHVCYEDKKS